MTVLDPTADNSSGRTYQLLRLGSALALMTIAGAAMYATIVALKPVASEFGVGRAAGSMPYTLFMVGFGIGGVWMGKLSDRIGIFLPALFGSLCLPGAFFLASWAAQFWIFCVAMGVLGGLFGASVTFAPLVADISHWFSARRGLAIGIVISGTYLAGTVWPPILQIGIDTDGWRSTFLSVGWFCLLTMLPLSAALYRRAPGHIQSAGSGPRPADKRPLGFAPARLQGLLCVAGIGCCVAMSAPQVHIVAYATDLGHAAVQGATMLSLMFGCGIVSRLVSGWLSDRVGGLRTLIMGSLMQALALTAFVFAETVWELYLASIAFGLSQGGIVPSYAMIVRRYFDPGDAGWRIGLTFLATILGMALGAWLAGALYDLSGSYTLSFVGAIGFNLFNIGIVALLISRASQPDSAQPDSAAQHHL